MADYTFSVDGAETSPLLAPGENAIVRNLAFFDTDDTVAGAGSVGAGSILAFDLPGGGADPVVNLTGYDGITGFKQIFAVLGGVPAGTIDLTIGENFHDDNAAAGLLAVFAATAAGGNVVIDASGLGAGRSVLLETLSDSQDVLTGGAGNDRILGGPGADTLTGGAGIDTLTYTPSMFPAPATGVTVSLVDGSIGTGGLAEGDQIFGFENLVGASGNDNLTGNAGNNILVGRGGNDVLTGGQGNDSYDIDAGDTVVEEAGEGTDAIYTAASYTLAAGFSIEKLVAHAVGALDLAGNELKQSIYGNAGNNRLAGGGGEDGLVGNGGDDVFDYNAASDSAPGTGAFDIINGFSTGDLIDLQDVFGATLSFIGTNAYSGAAGEVRYTAVGAVGAIIRVNLDADLADEMQIYVIGTAAPVAGDFVL